MLVSLLIHFTEARTLRLPPVVVQGGDLKHQEMRPAEWTIDYETTTDTIQLPQLDESLNALPGFQARTQGSPTLALRGSAQSGRVLSLYNNIPLNFASSFGAPNIFVPKETLSELAVVKGPASLFYGSQAMSGAVNFLPRKYDSPEFAVNFSDTNESFLPGRKGDVAHQSWFFASPLIKKEKNFLQGSLFYEDNDGAFPYQSPRGSGVREFNAQNLSRVTLLGVSKLDDIHLSYDVIAGKEIRQSPGPINSPVITRQESDGLLASLTPHIFISDYDSLKFRLSYLESRSNFLESGVTTFTNMKTIILQSEWITDFSRFTKLQVFLDGFTHYLDDSFAGSDLSQAQIELGPFFTFHSLNWLKHQIGGRYVSRNNILLPSLSTHVLLDNSDFWMSYSEGYRNPSLSDLYSQNSIFVGNANLDAEQSEQFELGYKQTSEWTDSQLAWELRFFVMNYRDFIETFQPTPGVFSKQNIGEGSSRGADLGIQWKNPWLDLALNYNYLDTFNVLRQRAFRLSPEHQLNFQGGVEWASWYFQFQNIHWYNTIDLYLNQPEKLPDWQQWNFMVHYQFTKKSRLSFGLINAFNQAKELTLFYPEPQRKYWLQFRHSF